MSTSEARILANRANSLKSTGPKTSEGKAISRRNGLKHGMAGEGVVLPEAAQAEVEARDAELQAELAPKSALGRILVRRMASTSVLMERAGRQREAAVARRVLHAVDDFDHDRLDDADRLLEILGEDPRGLLRQIKRTPEGVERLILAWRDLRADLTLELHPVWTEWHRERAANLTGHRVAEPGAARVGVLSKASWGDFSGLTDRDGAGPGDDARKAWARGLLLERIDAELADLEADFEAFDFGAIEEDRAGAPDRALFDPSKEASLARRYEGEAARGFFKALDEFRAVEAEAEVKAKAAEAEAALVRKYGVLASSRDRVGPPLPPARTAIGPVGPRAIDAIPKPVPAPASPPRPPGAGIEAGIG